MGAQLYAVIDGRGSWRSGDIHLRPGANPVTQEQADVILAKAPEWVVVQEGRELPRVLERPEPEPEPEPYAKFQGRDGKWYYHAPVAGGDRVEQSRAFESEDAVDAAIAEARSEKPLVPLADELEQGPEGGTMRAGESALGDPVTCRGAGCDRTFRDTGARVNHERIQHPELFEVR